MNNWIRVECPDCRGEGLVGEPGWLQHPWGYKMVTCPSCRGRKILLARPVELKPLDESEIRCKCGVRQGDSEKLIPHAKDCPEAR